MKIYTKIVTNPVAAGEHSVEQVRLSFDDRKRGRLKITTSSGDSAGIQIERGHVLRDGSWLQTESGELLHVLALDEEVTTAFIEDKTLFARACYHLGNRHVPLQVGNGFLRYQCDYVLDDMLKGLGVEPQHEQAIFEPENGAYAPVTGHSHGHSHSHGHDHYDEHSHKDSVSHGHSH